MDKEVRDLVVRLKNGELSVWDELYRRTEKSAYRTARRVLKDRYADDIPDMVQEAYIAVWRNIDQLEDPDKFQVWFNKVVTNYCLRELDKHKALSFSDIVAEDEERPEEWEDEQVQYRPEEMAELEADKQIIAEIFETLPETQKECLELYYISGFGVNTIAETLGVPKGTVQSRLKYGRDKVKAEILRREKEEGFRLHDMSAMVLLALYLRQLLEDTVLPQSLLVPPEIPMIQARWRIDPTVKDKVGGEVRQPGLSSGGPRALGPDITGFGTSGLRGASAVFSAKSVLTGVGVVAAAGVAVFAVNSRNTQDSKPEPTPIAVVEETRAEPTPAPSSEPQEESRGEDLDPIHLFVQEGKNPDSHTIHDVYTPSLPGSEWACVTTDGESNWSSWFRFDYSGRVTGDTGISEIRDQFDGSYTLLDQTLSMDVDVIHDIYGDVRKAHENWVFEISKVEDGYCLTQTSDAGPYLSYPGNVMYFWDGDVYGTYLYTDYDTIQRKVDHPGEKILKSALDGSDYSILWDTESEWIANLGLFNMKSIDVTFRFTNDGNIEGQFLSTDLSGAPNGVYEEPVEIGFYAGVCNLKGSNLYMRVRTAAYEMDSSGNYSKDYKLTEDPWEFSLLSSNKDVVVLRQVSSIGPYNSEYKTELYLSRKQ